VGSVYVAGIGYYIGVFGGDQSLESSKGALNEGLVIKDAQKLFGIVLAAFRPESASDASRHNNSVWVHWVI